MPTKSPKQHRFMDAVAHNPKFAKKTGIPQKVGKEFVRADKRMADGGGVNAAGNYTKPELRKRIVSQVKSAATHGTGAGEWSARKAQLVAKKYKAAGGGYRD
jgi:hypothetical protein